MTPSRLVPVLLGACLLSADEAHPSTRLAPGATWHWFGLVYLAGQIHFRDASGEKWPTYFYAGKQSDAQGSFTFDPAKPRLSFALTFPHLVQAGSDQRLKILGELLPEPERPPTVRFTIAAIGGFLPSAPPEFADVASPGPHEFVRIDGTLQVGARNVRVDAPARITYQIRPAANGLVAGALLGDSVKLRCRFSVSGADLGLVADAKRRIDVSIESNAFSEAAILAKTRKASLAEVRAGK